MGASASGGPLVSIVVPCRDHARFLAEAVESALAQTHRRIEVVVVDDGSADDSAGVARSFAPRGVRSVRQANAGLPAARNAGARAARGEFLAFLDADDALDPAFVEKCLAALAADPKAGFAYTQLMMFGRESQTTAFAPYSLKRLLKDNFISATALVRARHVRARPFDESFKTGWEDWDFYLALAERGVGGVLVDEPLVRYRKHESASSMLDVLSADRRRQLALRLRIIAAHPALFSQTARLDAVRRHVQDSLLDLIRGRRRA